MNRHTKKMIAPIIITILMLFYYLGLIMAILYFKPSAVVCAFAVLIPAVLGGVMIGVCVQRIKEIRRGEEDDLSKY